MQDKLKKCFDEGKRGGERHKGLRKITLNDKEAKSHIIKALHNFSAITDFYNMGYSDWSASAAFYTLYHGLLAILAQKGYESRNQSCTFALVEEMIANGEIKHLTIEEIREIYDRDVTEDIAHSSKMLDIREQMQYSTSTSLKEEEFDALKKRTKELLDKIRLEVERNVE